MDVKNEKLNFFQRVEIQRDLDYWNRKFKKTQTLFMQNLQIEGNSTQYARQLAEIDCTLHELHEQIKDSGSVGNLRYAIYEGMKSKGWDNQMIANRAGVKEETVQECLSNGKFLRSAEHTHFGMWAIREFDLDANCFISYFI